MLSKDSGTTIPRHAPPIPRAEFLSIRQSGDPDRAYADVCRILAEDRDPDDALAECSDVVDGFGVESLTLADGSEFRYVNKGDTYEATLCHTDADGYFVSSWGDAYEAADREHEADTGERRCCYCSEWTEPSEPCGSCGRDPETGDPVPEDLRSVRLETGHTLRTWDTGKLCAGRTVIGYELASPNGERIFRGTDFRCSALHAIDSDASLRALLGFLTLRPGDTDPDYFAGYSAAQRAFCESSECEYLAFLYSDDGPGAFTDAEHDGTCWACGRTEDMGDALADGGLCAPCAAQGWQCDVCGGRLKGIRGEAIWYCPECQGRDDA